MTTIQTTDRPSAPQLLGRHYFCFNDHDNGGESFGLETKIWNKYGMLYPEQEFSLNSYCNGSHFKLNGEVITTDQLRQLANELDKKWATLISRKEVKRQDTLLATHTFTFILAPHEPPDEGDNTLSLITEYFDNGDGAPKGIYSNQKLVMQSYGNTASFNLCGTSISADHLRKLANELDVLMSTINTDGLVY